MADMSRKGVAQAEKGTKTAEYCDFHAAIAMRHCRNFQSHPGQMCDDTQYHLKGMKYKIKNIATKKPESGKYHTIL
ncbi:hypothetical protein [Alteraurantiacibacter palmitatis]|uniref:Uncharacterized protein n=1 Tax=Alteraurantiacibacter palmitatis TaxID=2054628 RepID=A0ABV7E7X8_9SPHN